MIAQKRYYLEAEVDLHKINKLPLHLVVYKID